MFVVKGTRMTPEHLMAMDDKDPLKAMFCKRIDTAIKAKRMEIRLQKEQANIENLARMFARGEIDSLPSTK